MTGASDLEIMSVVSKSESRRITVLSKGRSARLKVPPMAVLILSGIILWFGSDSPVSMVIFAALMMALGTAAWLWPEREGGKQSASLLAF